MNILLVEDESRVADFIRRGLRAEGWRVSHAPDGRAALNSLSCDAYDIIIMDVMLPDVDGRELCGKLRECGNATPILMLTALSAVEERVQGLRAGADDYLPKPFDFDELLARLEALARRPRTLYREESPVTEESPMRRIPEGRAVGLGGREVELTPKENELLALLTASPGEVFSRARILSRVWGLHEDPLTNVVDVYIRRLRKKLGQSGAAIRTVRGAGYSFQTDPGETPHD